MLINVLYPLLHVSIHHGVESIIIIVKSLDIFYKSPTGVSV